MPNDQLVVSDEPDLFLEYLLRCALTAPGAASSPTAGRILARLLVVGAIEGGDELITPYLVPLPGEDAAFEVRTYHPGDLVPMEVRDGLRAAAALKIALRGARDSDNGIEVVSRGQSGLERCVLVRDSTGDFEFRFASPETMIGDPADCSAACAAWISLFADWREGAVAEVPGPEDSRWLPTPAPTGPVAVTPPAPVPLGPPVAPEQAARPALGTRGWWTSVPTDDRGAEPAPAPEPLAPEPLASEPPAPEPPAPEPPASEPPAPEGEEDVEPAAASDPAPPAPEPAAAVVAVEEPAAAAGPLPAPPRPTVPGPDPVAAPAPASPPAPARAPAPTLEMPAAEDLSAAIRDAIGNLVVEVDLGQVEQLIRRLLDDDRRDMVEPLARRLSARLGESLELPDTRALVDAVSLVIPQPGDLAEAVASDIGALLSETILRRRPGEGGMGPDSASVLAGIEQLHVRVDGLEDQFRKTAGMLHVLGEHLDAGDRRAAIAERITISVDQEMQRLANRIDEQVTALAASAGGGSELSDGVARLTRKLRQSVAELDRALVRLDEVVDQVGGGRGRLGLARGGGPAADPAPPRPPGSPGRVGPVRR